MRVEELKFRSGGVELAGTLTLPARPLPVSAVILASGSGHHDRDETVCGKKPFNVIARHLAANGWASCRFDDRGVGQSGGYVDAATFQSAVDDILATQGLLATDPRISRTVLLGHSEGGLVAAAAAATANTPVAMLAAPAVPIEELLHRQAWHMSATAGASQEQLLHEREMNVRVFEIARSPGTAGKIRTQVEEAVSEFLRSWPKAAQVSEEERNRTASTMASIVAAADFRSLLHQEPAAILRRVQTPLLALFGELDCQVEATGNLQAFRAATAHNRSARGHVFAGMNHLFQRAVTGAIQEYESLGQSPDTAVLTYVVEWLERVTTRGSSLEKRIG